MRSPPACVVTGGATGLGAAVAQLLADRGWEVTVTEHDRAAGDDHPTVTAVPCDLADPMAVDRLGDRLDPGPDAVVHCATVFERRPLGRSGKAVDGQRQTAVHLLGIDRLLRRLAADGRQPERIVLVGSAGAGWGAAGLAAYSAHKTALRGYVHGLSREWAGRTTVNLVEPGPMATALAEERASTWQRDAARSPVPVRVAPADQVARAIAFLLEPPAVNVSGAVLPVDGGLMASIAP